MKGALRTEGEPSRRKAKPILAIFLTLVLLVFLAATSALRALSSASAWVQHSDETRIALERLLTAVEQAESHTRGFLLTGDPTFRAAAEAASRALPEQLARVRALTQDNASQQERLRLIEGVATKRLGLLEEHLLEHTAGESPSNIAATVHRGREAMRQLSHLIDEMKVEEQALDGRREHQQRVRFELLMALLVIGTVASAASGAVLIVRHRDALRRDRHYAERERLLDRLEQSLNTVDALIGNSPVGISLFDRELRFVRLNEVVAQTTGLPISDHIGRRISDLLPQTRGLTEKKLAHVLATGEPIVDGEIVAEAPRQAGDVRVWQVSVFPVKGRDGTVSGVGMLSRDITERERVQRERAETLRFAEQFVGILGHDLRTPLGAIQMAALTLKGKFSREGALDGGGESKPGMGAARCVEIVLSSVRRMNELTTQLLDLTRARLAGGIPIERRSGNLSAVVAATIDEVRAAFPDRSIRSEIGPDIVGVLDLDRLAQVISNLTVNAIFHGDPSAPVEVRLRLEEQVVLEVHNRGTPIPEEDQLHIFDPYRRGERPGATKGLGLGLYITRQIVLAHGGEITVTSSSSGGTTFVVRLPREAEGSRDGGPCATTSAPEASTAAGAPDRVVF